MIPMGHSIIPHYLKYIGLDMDKITEISQYLINKVRKPEQFKKLIGILMFKRIKQWFQDWKNKRKLRKNLKIEKTRPVHL